GRSRAATRGRKALTRLACGLLPQPSASTRRNSKAGQLASMTAGAMSAVRSARCPIRWSPIWPKRDKRAPKSAPYATVTRVLTSPDGAKATAVEYYDANKQKQVQEASVVVLAAWSAQNPRLMLNSATDKHPNGLANSSGLVGKYLTAHFASGTSALFDEDLQPS